MRFWSSFSRAFVVATLVAMLSVAAQGVAVAQSIIKLSTTSSIDNAGLLRFLLPAFEKKYNVKVNVIAVGTGKALELVNVGRAFCLARPDLPTVGNPIFTETDYAHRARVQAIGRHEDIVGTPPHPRDRPNGNPRPDAL